MVTMENKNDPTMETKESKENTADLSNLFFGLEDWLDIPEYKRQLLIINETLAVKYMLISLIENKK